MATKLVCDGCDVELTDPNKGLGDRAGLTGTFSCPDGPLSLGQFKMGPWDLCGPCIRRLQEIANPLKWGRR